MYTPSSGPSFICYVFGMQLRRTARWGFCLRSSCAHMLLCSLLLAAASCSRIWASDLEGSILQVQAAIEAGDLQAASRLLDLSLRAHPRAGGLLNLRGVVHAQRSELAAARADFEAAVRLAPGLSPAWQNLARACQIEAEGKSAAAESKSSGTACAMNAWQHVIGLVSGNAEAHSSLARLYERTGQFSKSLHEIGALSASEAAQTDNLLIRCADLAAWGEETAAKQAASELAARADLSEQDWKGVAAAFAAPRSAPIVVILGENLESRNANGLESLRSLAIAYEQLQRPQDARKVLERLAALDPKNTSHLLELARLADAAKDYEGALGYLGHARDLRRDDPQIHFLFAKVAMEMNLPVEARASLERALSLDSKNPVYNYAMGFVILGTRDAATAGTYFEKFVKARPREVKGHYALGIAYFASGDYARSKEEMRRVAGDPKTAGGAEYFLGQIARREDDLDEAQRHLQRSIELLPGFSESHTEMARIYLLEGKMAEARQQLESAVRLDPTSFPANEQLLVLYRRTHDPAAERQAVLVKKLDAERSKRAELMLRTIEFRP